MVMQQHGSKYSMVKGNTHIRNMETQLMICAVCPAIVNIKPDAKLRTFTHITRNETSEINGEIPASEIRNRTLKLVEISHVVICNCTSVKELHQISIGQRMMATFHANYMLLRFLLKHWPYTSMP